MIGKTGNTLCYRRLVRHDSESLAPYRYKLSIDYWRSVLLFRVPPGPRA